MKGQLAGALLLAGLAIVAKVFCPEYIDLLTSRLGPALQPERADDSSDVAQRSAARDESSSPGSALHPERGDDSSERAKRSAERAESSSSGVVESRPGAGEIKTDGYSIDGRGAHEDYFPRGYFAEHCEQWPGKRVVLVTVSAGYVDMFTNWLGSAVPFLKETEQLHVVAEDMEVVEAIEASRREFKLDFSVGLPPEMQAKSHGYSDAGFGDAGFGDVVWRRPLHILQFLDKGCSVLYADIDTVWVNDVFRVIGDMGIGDIYLTDDSNVPYWNFCTCFMYLNPTHAMRTLLINWVEHREGNFNQQGFNKQLFLALNATDDTQPRLKALPFESFPPGPWADEVPGPSVLHANYLKGMHAKVNWLQERGHWNPHAAISQAFAKSAMAPPGG